MFIKRDTKIKNMIITKTILAILCSILLFSPTLSCSANVHKSPSVQEKLKIDSSKQKTIEVSDEYYRGILNEIKSNPLKYKAKKIIISGFVFKPDDLSKNSFYISRIWMYCCAADAQIIGFPVQCNNSSKLNEGDWLKITGSINVKSNYNKELKKSLSFPFIKVIKIEKIKPPQNEYVY